MCNEWLGEISLHLDAFHCGRYWCCNERVLAIGLHCIGVCKALNINVLLCIHAVVFILTRNSSCYYGFITKCIVSACLQWCMSAQLLHSRKCNYTALLQYIWTNSVQNFMYNAPLYSIVSIPFVQMLTKTHSFHSQLRHYNHPIHIQSVATH